MDGPDDGPDATGSTAQANGAKAMDALGVKTIAELRAKPLNELDCSAAGGLVVDGYLIPEDLSLTFRPASRTPWTS